MIYFRDRPQFTLAFEAYKSEYYSHKPIAYHKSTVSLMQSYISLTWIDFNLAWINGRMPRKVRDGITYPFPNLNGYYLTLPQSPGTQVLTQCVHKFAIWAVKYNYKLELRWISVLYIIPEPSHDILKVSAEIWQYIVYMTECHG